MHSKGVISEIECNSVESAVWLGVKQEFLLLKQMLFPCDLDSFTREAAVSAELPVVQPAGGLWLQRSQVWSFPLGQTRKPVSALKRQKVPSKPLLRLKTALARPLRVNRKNWPFLQTGNTLFLWIKYLILYSQIKKVKPNYTVPTLKGLGSIYQMGPVQWTISTSVRQRHENRVLQLLL